MNKTKKMVTAADAAVTRSADMKRTAGKLKRGWNWEYKFVEKVLPDGSRETFVAEYMLHHHKCGTDVIVSCNPGAHPYEDA